MCDLKLALTAMKLNTHDLSALKLELGILKGGQAEVSLYARLTTAERQSH